jgi:metallo-beta-lactamase family protein
MHLTFWGAARQVTGSMYLLEFENNYKILLDCGIDFSRDGNRYDEIAFPFTPAEINLVLLTHAHLDHSGNLPALISQGYRGKIVCTAPTLQLTSLLLEDAADVSRSRKQTRVSGKGHSRRPDFLDLQEEVATENTTQEALSRFSAIPFHTPTEIHPGIKVTFVPAGHLLGAASIFFEIEENGKIKKLGFSGDRGRKDYPMLKDPEPLPQVDYLICETTYGSRSHLSELLPEVEISEVINKACIENKGRLIVPAFSIGRTQTLLYILHKLSSDQKFNKIKVFTDSPMAERATRVYQESLPFLNIEAQKVSSDHDNLFDFDNLVQVESYKESKSISNYHEPCIIISSSGMITGGRMQYHIRKNINNPYCTVLVIGYSAEGTPGYQLTSGDKTIRIKGRDIPIAANIVVTDVFSGHADREDLLDFVKSQNPQQLKNIFLVHGEYESMKIFRDHLMKEGYSGVEMPSKGSRYEL